MKKLINYLAWAACFCIVLGLEKQWDEKVMYLLFVISITLALVCYFQSEQNEQ